MKKTTALLLTAILVLPSAVILAADAPDMPKVPDAYTMDKDLPKLPDVTVPSLPSSTTETTAPSAGSTGMAMPAMPGMISRTVLASSDGGIIVVTGNKITKFDKDLKPTKTIELTDDESTNQQKH